MKWIYAVALFILFSLLLVVETHAEELILKTFILPSGNRYDTWVSPLMERLNAEAVKYLPRPQTILALVPKIPEVQADGLSLRDQIAYYIDAIATKWGLDSTKMGEVADCESGWQDDAQEAIKAKGDYRNGVPMAFGLWQYWEKTFNRWKIEANMLELEYTNWRHQTELTGFAWSKGYQNSWTCHK